MSDLTPSMKKALIKLLRQVKYGEKDDLDISGIHKSTLFALQRRGYIRLYNFKTITRRAHGKRAKRTYRDSSFNVRWVWRKNRH